MQLIPQVFATQATCLKWGGYVKDVKLRPTARYQFAMAGAKKLTVWGLEPATGQCTTELVTTGTFVRDYTCMCFSIPDEQYLFAGTSSGDFCCF